MATGGRGGPNLLRKMTLIHGGHARENGISDVHMAHDGTQRNDTQHNGIIGFNIKVAHMAHPYPCLQGGKTGIEKQELQL